MFTIKNEDVVSADLLSVKEAQSIPIWIRACGEWWWLQSLGLRPYSVATVRYDGSVDELGDLINYDDNAIRPAITVLNLPLLEIGETVKVFGQMAQYIGNKKVLLCEPVFKSRFDENSNSYETSEVKHKLDEWFAQMKGEEK